MHPSRQTVHAKLYVLYFLQAAAGLRTTGTDDSNIFDLTHTFKPYLSIQFWDLSEPISHLQLFVQHFQKSDLQSNDLMRRTQAITNRHQL